MNPERILIIEDSKFYSSTIQKRIRNILSFETVAVETYAEAEELLRNDTDFFVALVDLHLPDSNDFEAADLTISKDIPTIIMTGDFDEDLRKKVISKKKIVDYIFKQQTQGFKVVTDLIRQLARNKNTKVLIAEDSPTQRLKLRKILELQQYLVLEAENGDAAFRVFEENPDIKLVLTDYNMPVIDGFDLVNLIRRKADKDTVAIIGISSEGNSFLSAKFLKTGANDFLTKPIEPEELIARASLNIEMLDMMDKLKNLAIKDPLTKLHNRRYFYDEGEKLFLESKRETTPLAVALMDIDKFKTINDEYGHAAGDEALKMLSELLLENTRGLDVAARLGGDEFCVMAAETDKAGAGFLFEKIRKRIAETDVVHEDRKFRFTVSIGVACGAFVSLADMMRRADQNLYTAKAEGNNRVVLG